MTSRSRSLRPLLVGLALVFLAPAAHAHEVLIPIGADAVSLSTPTPESAAFSFDATNQVNIFVGGHDPSVDSTALLVRGTGANAARTPLITLDPTAWSIEAADDFRYDDSSGARGGVTGVDFASQTLHVDAGGANWSLAPAGPLDELWLHFRIEDEWYCARFDGATASANQADLFTHGASTAPGACPESVCGNGDVEPGEECDDGNLVDDDTCSNTCLRVCETPDFTTTYEGIQQVVFESEVYGCTNLACHGGFVDSGGLDLRAENSYAELLGSDGLGEPACDRADCARSELKRVEPAEPELSFLYQKLAARTLGTPLEPDTSPNQPMPTIGEALTEEHLEAVRLWIRGGAPEDLVVQGTDDLLGTCLPDPDPLKIPIPDPPPMDGEDATGVQFRQTPWDLPGLVTGQGEDEICMATYYDVSAQVPDWAKVPCPPFYQQARRCSQDNSQVCEQDADCGGANTCDVITNATNPQEECFRFHKQTLWQDPQSHHSIIHVYRGSSDTDDGPEGGSTWWGDFTYKLEPDDPDFATQDGLPCDPLAIDPAVGVNPGCSGDPISGVACTGYGPPDASNFSVTGGGAVLPTFSGSQEPFYEQEFADGVYSTLPVRGVIVWNSHAFNLTDTDTTMAQYLNLEFARPEDQLYPLQGIFDAEWIFAQSVPSFGTQEICATHTLRKGSRLFELSSHTHIRGVRWRTWEPPNTPCQPRCPETEQVCIGSPPLVCFCDNRMACSNNPERGCGVDGDCLDGGTCEVLPFCDELDYPPDERAPIYFSTDYSDPLQLAFDPPIALDAEAVEDRTYLFCSLYDNGSTPESPAVKQASTSPLVPVIEFFGLEFRPPQLGGPCVPSKLTCLDGPNRGLSCFDGAIDHAFCGDPSLELCDACPAQGGVTTEDEMFILLGNFFVPASEPTQILLGLTALVSVGALAGLRRRA